MDGSKGGGLMDARMIGMVGYGVKTRSFGSRFEAAPINSEDTT